jgi:hypothetical protein
VRERQHGIVLNWPKIEKPFLRRRRLVNTPFALNASVLLAKAVSEPRAENSAFHLPAHHVTSPDTSRGETQNAPSLFPCAKSLRRRISSQIGWLNYCLLRAEILLSIADPGVRYLFRSSLTSPLLVRGPHYTHVYLLHAVYCQTLLAGQLDFAT